MLPGDRLVCAFVKPQAVGVTFQKWLLHVTIVPWFRLADGSEAIAAGLTRALAGMKPFEARAAEATLFGPHKNRPAMLLAQPSSFDEIEAKVRSYLHKKRAWLVDETTKRRYEFRPHVTAQGEQSVTTGQIFHCDRLYIVEQKGDYRQSYPNGRDMPEVPASGLMPAEPPRRGGLQPKLDSFGFHGNYKEIVSEVHLG